MRRCFAPQMMTMPASMAKAMGGQAGQPVAYYPRRNFDLWGTALLPAARLARLGKSASWLRFVPGQDRAGLPQPGCP